MSYEQRAKFEVTNGASAVALGRDADSEVERLRGEVEELKQKARMAFRADGSSFELESSDAVVEYRKACAGRLAELDKIKSAAGSEDPIALIEAGKKLPKIVDIAKRAVAEIENHQFINLSNELEDFLLAREAKEKGENNEC